MCSPVYAAASRAGCGGDGPPAAPRRTGSCTVGEREGAERNEPAFSVNTGWSPMGPFAEPWLDSGGCARPCRHRAPPRRSRDCGWPRSVRLFRQGGGAGPGLPRCPERAAGTRAQIRVLHPRRRRRCGFWGTSGTGYMAVYLVEYMRRDRSSRKISQK